MSSQEYQSKSYFLYTILSSSIFWLIAAYYSFNDKSIYIYPLILGLITPFLMLIYFIYKDKTRKLKKEFIRKLFNFNSVNFRVSFIFIVLMPLSVIFSIFISIAFGGSLEQLTLSEKFSFSTGFIPIIILLLIAATFEELGWRGYGFESLENKFNFFFSCLIFSLLWSFWHLPLIFVNDSYQYIIHQESIFYSLNFYLSIIPLAFIISWAWARNGRNIPIAIAFHLIVNLSQEAFEINHETKIIQTFILFLMAILIIILEKDLFFNKRNVNNEE